MITRSELLAFMRSCPLVTAATVSPDGAPAAAILGVAVSERLELVFDTLDTSRKFRNLQSNSRVAIVFGAAGSYESGKHDERTVQYEGNACVPSGEELKRAQEEIYFKLFPDARSRLQWAHIAYVHVKPVWLRYCDYNARPAKIIEFTRDELSKLIGTV